MSKHINRAGHITNSAVAMGENNSASVVQGSPGATIVELRREARALECDLASREHGGAVVEQVREFRAAVDEEPAEPGRIRELWNRLSGGLEVVQVSANVAQIASLVLQLH